MADTEIETETMHMVADHAKKIHAREATKATVTKRTPAKSAGTKGQQHCVRFVVVGLSLYSLYQQG